jgi:hypothetical protein
MNDRCGERETPFGDFGASVGIVLESMVRYSPQSNVVAEHKYQDVDKFGSTSRYVG